MSTTTDLAMMPSGRDRLEPGDYALDTKEDVVVMMTEILCIQHYNDPRFVKLTVKDTGLYLPNGKLIGFTTSRN